MKKMLSEWTIDLTVVDVGVAVRKLVLSRQAEEEILTLPVSWKSYTFMISPSVLKIRLFDYDANGEIVKIHNLL